MLATIECRLDHIAPTSVSISLLDRKVSLGWNVQDKITLLPELHLRRPQDT